MKHFMKNRSALTLLGLWIIITLLCPARAMALDLNEEGRALILEATQAYNTDMRDRPTVTDQAVVSYATQIARRLLPEGKHPPEGVSLSTTVIESPRPEIYAYIDGHLVMTTGVLFAMDNEAQLAGVLAHEIAHIAEGYYIRMYQEIKATEKHQRHKAAAGALFTSLLDVAVDYAVEVEDIRQTDRMFSGEITYREAMKRMAAVGATQYTGCDPEHPGKGRERQPDRSQTAVRGSVRCTGYAVSGTGRVRYCRGSQRLGKDSPDQ
jgi:hypothetical protein